MIRSLWGVEGGEGDGGGGGRKEEEKEVENDIGCVHIGFNI